MTSSEHVTEHGLCITSRKMKIPYCNKAAKDDKKKLIESKKEKVRR